MRAERPVWDDVVRSHPALVGASFLHWTRHTPRSTALRERGREWTYAELACAALSISGQLRQVGCRPGDVIAIDGCRSGEFIAALLGVLLSRCVALPLDPGQPPVWRRDALEQAGVRLSLRCAGVSAPEHGRLALDADFTFPHAHDELDPELPGLDDPAYLFFTSGTTGRPKGVLGTHGGLAHFLAWQRETFQVAPGDRVAHVTGLSFDVVLREIFVALTSGATLSIPDRVTMEDPAQLMRWFADESVSLLHAVPTLASVWLAEADAGLRLPRLRASFFAGEPLARQLVVRWRDRLDPDAEIINLYGPTETTLAKCWYRVPRRLPFDQVPVGKPLPGCEVFVVDVAGRPVAQGETGEVVIRTPWRTRGYLNAPSPFRSWHSDDDSAYFTGDQGRILRDGSLVLLGRIDDQVKIRGVRVEPAGVSAVLARHPGVRACAVLARATESQPRLIAYVVGNTGRAELRAYLAERLADAQVPTEFHFLSELPVTANGKLDRVRLAELLATPPGGDAAFRERPQGESEKLIASIYAELLALPPEHALSARDDFFDLGGDSLQALAVISRINQAGDEQAWGGRLDVADLFETPEIRGLAERLDALRGELAAAATTPLRPLPRGPELPLSPVQERIWFQCQLDHQLSIAYNVPVAIEILGPLDIDVFEATLQTVLERHEVLRTCFPVRDDRAFVAVRPAPAEPLNCIDVSGLGCDEQESVLRRRAQAQADCPFLLERELPFRMELVRRADDLHVLLLTVHHLAFDGWSRWMLIRELGEHYTALSQGLPTAPPPLIQYADYAVWRRQAQPREQSLAYWRQRLRDAPTLDLPADRVRPVEPSFIGAQVVRELSAASLEDLERLAVREKATLFMVLLTAFKLAMSRWTGVTDLVIGSPVANRPRPELERLIGCFIEMLPIRSDLSGACSGVEALQRVRAAVIGAFAHADVPFEKIVEHVAPPRRAGHHPLFDVMFNFVNVPQKKDDPQGLTMSFAEWTAPEAKFDLSVYVHRTGDGLQLKLVYRTALFLHEPMVRLLDAVIETLRGLADQPMAAIWPLHHADIRSTPTPSAEPVAAVPHRVAPRTSDERKVVEVFRELLGREDVSVHDSFFALGGHSLLAMQLMSHLRRGFDVALPLRLIFASQTPAELAVAIQRVKTEGSGEVREAEAITLNQQRLLCFMAQNPCSVHYNLPRRLRLRGSVDVDLFEQAINHVAAAHSVLATGYRLEGSKGVSVPRSNGAAVVMRRLDVASEADPEAAANRLVADEIARPFVLDGESLLRALLIRTAEQEYLLLLVIHHIIADCRSMGMSFDQGGEPAGKWMAGVFLRQLWTVYGDLRAGRSITLPEVPQQHADVARRQNSWLAGPEAARQLDYWQRLLGDRPPALTVPEDFPRPPKWDFQGARLPLDISPDLAQSIRAFAAGQGTTLFVVFQAAFAVLLHDRTGAHDLVTGTTVGNRSGWEADELIGYFSNNLTLRTDLSGDPDFYEIVRRSHESAFAAFARQELSFEMVLHGLGIEPEPDRHPLFQVRQILHLPTDPPFRDDELSMTLEGTGLEVAKYDMTLLLADTGEAFVGWLEYATSLYRRDTAERMVQRYCRLLPALFADPAKRLSDIVVMS